MKPYELYDDRAEEYAERYEAITFEEVHANLLRVLPEPPAMVLDVGAGSGRDAAALARMGYCVTAVEPSSEMRRIGKEIHAEEILWINDSLPELQSLRDEAIQFDFILVSAVWMHLAPQERDEALDSLLELLKEEGLLALTLRMGPVEDNRGIYAVGVDELRHLAAQRKLFFEALAGRDDMLSRSGISWRTVLISKHSQQARRH